MFNSQLQIGGETTAGQADSSAKTGASIVLNETADHGPFRWLNWKSLNLVPAMALRETTLVNNDVTKPLFDIAKGESPFVTLTPVSATAAIPVPISPQNH